MKPLGIRSKLTPHLPRKPRHEVELGAPTPISMRPPVQVHQLQYLLQQELAEQLQARHREVGGHGFFNVHQRVLVVEPDHLAVGQLRQGFVGEQGETLEDVLVAGVPDVGGVLGLEVQGLGCC